MKSLVHSQDRVCITRPPRTDDREFATDIRIKQSGDIGSGGSLDINRLVYRLVVTMNEEIGAYEAKTRLPELLRAVKAGRRFTITNRGEAVADLVPSAAATLPERRATIERFQAFRAANAPPGGTGPSIRALIDEGRQ